MLKKAFHNLSAGTDHIMENERSIDRPWRFLVALVSLHVFLWTLIPWLSRTALPLDTLEGLTWGHAWQWGYDKNPYLNAWISEIFGYAGEWALYFASSLCVAICFWAIYQLAKKFFTPVQSVACAFLLEGIYYLTISVPQFNDNVLELALWPMAALFFYNALAEQKTRDWLLVGLVLGLSLMAKYLAVILMLPMLLFLLINPDARVSFKRKGLYLSVIPFALLTVPHIVWLFQNDFITMTYAFDRAERAWHFTNHFKFAFKFAGEQLLALLPSVLLSLWFIQSRNKSEHLSLFKKQFLLFVCAGPFITIVLLSMVKGYALEPMWGVPLLAPLTLIIMAMWKPALTQFRFMGLFTSSLVLLLLVTTVYGISTAYSPFSSNCKATAYYPGPQIAARITQLWREHSDAPLSFVAGPRWEAGNVAFYSADRPQVYMEFNPRVSTWIDEDELREKGAVFVWQLNPGSSKGKPSDLQKRFPAMRILPAEVFKQGACDDYLGVAILLPSAKN